MAAPARFRRSGSHQRGLSTLNVPNKCPACGQKTQPCDKLFGEWLLQARRVRKLSRLAVRIGRMSVRKYRPLSHPIAAAILLPLIC